VVRALGTFKDAKAAAALQRFAEKDESYYVEAEATSAWAASRLRPVPAPASPEVEQTEALLLKQLKKDSHRELIRGAALRALAELPGVGRGERPLAVAALIEWSRRGLNDDVRTAAVHALGAVARSAVASERARVLGVLSHLADESNYRLRLALVTALEKAGGEDANSLLAKIHSQDLDGRVKRNALHAMEVIGASGTVPESVAQLRTSLEKLEEDYRKLRSAFEEARAGLGK
jgi:HEAT repeat protein